MNKLMRITVSDLPLSADETIFKAVIKIDIISSKADMQ